MKNSISIAGKTIKKIIPTVLIHFIFKLPTIIIIKSVIKIKDDRII